MDTSSLQKEGTIRYSICQDKIYHLLFNKALGYTLSRDEFSVGLSAMASGLCDAEDKFAGAITIMGPSFRFSDRNVKQWGKLLLQTTSRLSLEFKAKGIM